MDTYAAEQQRLAETWDEVSTITDEDSAIRYLTEGLGYVINSKGQISAPKEQNRARRAMGGAGMAGEGRGESRAINFEEVQALQNLSGLKLSTTQKTTVVRTTVYDYQERYSLVSR